MTTGITARDKKLLYMLGIIVIAALFFIIGIRPTNRKIKEIDEKIDDAQVVHDTIKMKMLQLGTIEAFKNNAEDKAVELSSRYYEMMAPADADKFITNKALSYGLKVNNLNIKYDTEPVNLLAYTNSEAYALHQQAMEQAILTKNDEDEDKDKDKDKDKSSSGKTEKSDKNKTEKVEDKMVDIEVLASINDEAGAYSVEDTSSADVYVTSMVLDVYGSHDKAQALLDDIIKNQSLRVTSYEWTQMTTLPYQYVDGQLVTVAQDNGDRLIISFDMYMYSGAEFKKMVDEDRNPDAENEETDSE